MQDPIDSLIDVLYTQTLVEDQIKDTCEHAYPKTFHCHGRAHFQRHCDFSDCHPFFSVYSFDYYSTSATAIVFEASIPETTYRLPHCVLTSVDDNFPPPLCAYISPMVCFLIVFLVDMVHEAVDFRDRLGNSLLPPRVQDYLNFANCLLVRLFLLCSLGKFAIDPSACHITFSTQLYSRSLITRIALGLCSYSIPRLKTALPTRVRQVFVCEC